MIGPTISLVLIQALVAFSFLIFFYFFYVVNIEKEEFEKQIEYLVNDLLNDATGFLPSLDTDTKIVMHAGVDALKQKVQESLKEQIQQITDDNRKLKFKYLTIAGILIGVVIAFLTLLFFFFPGVDAVGMGRETLIVLIFIGVVEFSFLNIVSSNYIAVDPNQVRGMIGQSIKEWRTQQQQQQIPAKQ